MALTDNLDMYRLEYENTLKTFHNASMAFMDAGMDARRQKVLESYREMVPAAGQVLEALLEVEKALKACEGFAEENPGNHGQDSGEPYTKHKKR